MDKNQILKIFKSTGALLDGHFVLTSGRHSATYFQCAKVLQYPEYLTIFSALISDQFQDKKPDVVLSPAIGGIVLGTEVGVKLGCRTIFAERIQDMISVSILIVISIGVIALTGKVNPPDWILVSVILILVFIFFISI